MPLATLSEGDIGCANTLGANQYLADFAPVDMVHPLNSAYSLSRRIGKGQVSGVGGLLEVNPPIGKALT